MVEDATIEELTLEDVEKVTCAEGIITMKSNSSINDQVKDDHGQEENEKTKFMCTVCENEFTVAEDCDNHVKTHESINMGKNEELIELEKIVFNHNSF